MLTSAVQLRRNGFGLRLVVPGERSTRIDTRLVSLVVKAHTFRKKLVSGQHDSIESLAREEQVTPSYVTRVLRAAFLAPDITKAILDGRQPVGLTPDVLLRDSRLPLAWDLQRSALAN